MKKLLWYAKVSFCMVVLIVLIAGVAVWALVSCILDEIKQRHNRLALHQDISTFLAQQRQQR